MCVYIYIHIYTHTHTHKYTYIYMYTYIYIDDQLQQTGMRNTFYREHILDDQRLQTGDTH